MSMNTAELPAHITKRRTLVKDRVGCVRSPSVNLPPQDHIYGLKCPPDQEGAGAVISKWVTSNPSTHYNIGKKNVYSNVLALKNGYITAKGMRQYAQEHPNIRLKEPASDEGELRARGAHEGPFGIKSTATGDKFENIIQGRYMSYANDDGDYPDVSCIKKKGSMPKPKATHASELLMQAKNTKKTDKPRFIMSKFKNVSPTMHIHMTKVDRDNVGSYDGPASEVDEEQRV